MKHHRSFGGLCIGISGSDLDFKFKEHDHGKGEAVEEEMED